MTVLNGDGSPNWEVIEPSDMLFAVTLDGRDPDGNEIEDGPTVIMCPQEYWEDNLECWDDDIDYDWVEENVPEELEQGMESTFYFDHRGDWPSIRDRLLKAGFKEEPRLWEAPPG